MHIVYARCCGLDVRKKSITACVLLRDATGQGRQEIRRFETMTRDLLELADWLQSQQVTHVAMESTGIYWKPVWNILEGQFEVVLVNAQHVKAVPGRKTDSKDCQWIADLLQHGLLRGNYVPPPPIRQLRDLTRLRTSLRQDHTAVANRMQKILEDANIKLASVASDWLGVSGRAILTQLLAGEEDAIKLADLSRRRLRAKLPQMQLALQGRMTDHHRWMLRVLWNQLEFVESAACQWRIHLDQHPECPYVFSRGGKRIKYPYTAWRKAVKEARLEGNIPHDFRRTAVRNMVRAGIPERVAMQIAGHKSRSIFDRYHIVSETDLREAAQQLDRAFTEQTTTLSLSTTEGSPLTH